MKKEISFILLVTIVLLSIQQYHALSIAEPETHFVSESVNTRIVENASYRKNHKVDVGGLPECIICSFIVDRVEKYLLNSTNETKILEDLDNDCNHFRDQHDVQVCQDIVNKYLTTIINLLVNKEKPEVICAEIHLCGLSKPKHAFQTHQSKIEQLRSTVQKLRTITKN